MSPVIDSTIDATFVFHDNGLKWTVKQDADIVAFLHCSDEEREKQNSMMEFVIRKHRNGPLADVPLIFQRPTSSFVNMARVNEE